MITFKQAPDRVRKLEVTTKEATFIKIALSLLIKSSKTKEDIESLNKVRQNIDRAFLDK
tara:strand:- start:157 stop:333 length:177 start_codon:yes stop_codon:yes gene_type:complete